MIKKIFAKLEAEGIKGFVNAVFHRVMPRCLACYSDCKPFLKGRTGLEIGGPSNIFGRTGLIPVYTVAARIDNCNFGHQTIWEGSITEGNTFHFYKRSAPGNQYVTEATNLSRIASASYDFVLSSHVLEHVANPVKALVEWTRILKEQGLLVLVVPHRDGTFDHRRPVTSLAHLIQDFELQTSEGDMAHLEEILSLHDLAKDPGAGDFNAFKQRSMQNLENRSLHHHVFDTRLAIEVVHHIGLQILCVELFRPYHIIVIAQKPTPMQAVQNDHFRGMHTKPCWLSPFPSDQIPPH